jgi:hypothetical protein
MLSGIVTDNQTIIKPTTSLPAVIKYKLAYRTTEGYTATFKIAIGEQVSVNTIMGMAMIKPALFSLNLKDHVVDPGVLDTNPFEVVYKPTIRSTQDFRNLNTSEPKKLSTNSGNHITLANVVLACKTAVFGSNPVSSDKITKDTSKPELADSEPQSKPIQAAEIPGYDLV